ncbi:MAG: hypothetical protein WDA42_00890 [Candidatus Bathyarchaeia archaeon]
MKLYSQDAAFSLHKALKGLVNNKCLTQDVLNEVLPALERADNEMDCSWTDNDTREAKLVSETLLDWVNHDGDVAETVKLIGYGHRTLQQSLYPLVIGLIAMWAEDYERGSFDGRNEYTCKQCAKIVNTCKDFVDFERPGAPMI